MAPPTPARLELETKLREEPSHALTPARAELLQIMTQHNLADGRHEIAHPWGATSVLGNAFRHDVPLTVHQIGTISFPTIPSSTAPPSGAQLGWTSPLLADPSGA